MTWRPDDHPRWPAETPGGRGGEFRGDGPAGWARAAATGRLTFDQVRAYVGRTDFTASPLAGGHTASTELRTYSDGTQLVHKDFNWHHEAMAEVRFSEVAHQIGAPVPAVVWSSEPDAEVLMDYIPGRSAFMQSQIEHGGRVTDLEARQFVEQKVNTDDGILIGLVDVLMGHNDRHMANWIVTPDGGLVGIDNASAFEPSYYRGPGIAPSVVSPFAAHYIYRIPPEKYTVWDQLSRREQHELHDRVLDYVDNPLHPADIRLIRQRLIDMNARGQLENAPWARMRQILDDLEAHAVGTRRRIQ